MPLYFILSRKTLNEVLGRCEIKERSLDQTQPMLFVAFEIKFKAQSRLERLCDC